MQDFLYRLQFAIFLGFPEPAKVIRDEMSTGTSFTLRYKLFVAGREVTQLRKRPIECVCVRLFVCCIDREVVHLLGEDETCENRSPTNTLNEGDAESRVSHLDCLTNKHWTGDDPGTTLP